MQHEKNRIIFILLLLCSFNMVLGINKTSEFLLYPLRNYTIDNYNAGTQNWCFTELQDGTLCVANSAGLLVKNGNQWQLYPTTSHQGLRVACEYENKVYVGGGNEFGYFVKLKSGEFVYKQLSSVIKRKWGEIWRIERSGDKVFIQGGGAVFVFNLYNDTLEHEFYIEDDDRIRYFCLFNEKLFIQSNKYGCFLTNYDFRGREVIIENSQIGGAEVRGIVMFGSAAYILTLDQGIYIYESKKLVLKDTEVQNHLKQDQIFSFSQLGNKILVGTILNGVYILDRDLTTFECINVDAGLGNNTILSLFVDSNKNLWSGMDNGMSTILIDVPYRYPIFNNKYGSGSGFAYYKGYRYWSTNQGLYYSADNSSEVKLVEGTQGQVWLLKQIGDNLYCGHHKGLYEVHKNMVKLVNPEEGIMHITQLGKNSDRYLQISYYKINILEYNREKKTLDVVSNLDKSLNIPLNAFSDENGNIWYSDNRVVTRLQLDDNDWTVKEREDFEFSFYGTVFPLDKQIYYVNDKQIYKFYRNSFVSCTSIDYQGYNAVEILNFLYTVDQKVLYEVFSNANKLIDSFTEIKKHIKNWPQLGTYYDNCYVLNSNEGFVYQYPNMESRKERIKLNINEVKTKKNDQTKYAWFEDGILEYSNNNISFRFNVNTTASNVSYQYMLEGYDKKWSAFSSVDMKQYTNLPEGKYKFLVRAKINNEVTDTHRFEFEINPPYYRTLWAYLVYFFLFVIFIAVLLRWIDRLLVKKEIKLNAEKQKEIERIEKTHMLETLDQEKKLIQMERDRLEESIMFKQKELINSTHNIVDKNKLLFEIKEMLQSIYKEKNIETRDSKLKKIFNIIDSKMNNREDWAVFESSFLEVHQSFFERLKADFPLLSTTELKLCAYIKLNKSTKEIASLMNISVRGVETSRYRLRRKVGLDRNDNILDVLMKY